MSDRAAGGRLIADVVAGTDVEVVSWIGCASFPSLGWDGRTDQGHGGGAATPNARAERHNSG